ncbi:MAG: chemotaxis-specific protein-glutamate methyltransferase CheB [Lachnospiraceae bacterium]|nr:chemotaxis-specific protein-glutamate methyltransferase CheB [Lachnospiraceae bacterium]
MISENNATNTTINRKKVLVVDNSALMRRVVCDIIGKDSRFVVEDMCSDGLQAHNFLAQKSYDVAIVDVAVPKMTGLELLEHLREEKNPVKVIIVSVLNRDGANITIQALAMGAVDFITKPANLIEARGSDYEKAVLESLRQAVSLTGPAPVAPAAPAAPARPSSGPVTSGGKAIAAAAAEAARVSAGVAHTTPAVSRPETESTTERPRPVFTPRSSGETVRPVAPAKQAVPLSTDRGKLRSNKHIGPSAQIKLVAIASSTGGPKALKSVIPLLPANLDAPVVIVQHMPKDFTYMMAQKLNDASHLRVKEAEDGEVIRKGTVYIAPGGFHLNLEHSGSEERVRLSDEPIREGVKPCANYMYESLRSSIYDEITCVVLTGMGADGTAGIRALAENNNVMYTISQNEATCVVYGMPKAVYEAGLVNEVVPLTDVAEAIVKNVGVK